MTPLARKRWRAAHAAARRCRDAQAVAGARPPKSVVLRFCAKLREALSAS